MAGNPRPQTPNTDPGLAVQPGGSGSLVESLGEVADDLRQLYTDVGLRPYRVFSVVIRWTGGEVGRGDPVVESETEFLPRPVVVNMNGVRKESTPAGLNEKGSVRLRQVSPRYTEDDIRSLCHMTPLSSDRSGFIEIRMDDRDGSAQRRRFSVKGTPHRDAAKFQWTVELAKQDSDRSRTGKPHDVRAPAEVEMTRFDQD